MAVLSLPPELTQREASACLQSLASALAASPEPAVVIDASPLQRFDSTALAVLLACRRRAEAGGKTVAVRGLPDKLRQLAAVYGVDTLLTEVV